MSATLDIIEEGDASGNASVESGSTGGEERLSSTDNVPLAQKETRMVNYSKVLVVVVILVMASAIGLVTYQYVSSQEENGFKKQVRFVCEVYLYIYIYI